MKKIILYSLMITLLVIATSCSAEKGYSFPSWMQGKWDMDSDPEWIEVSEKTLVLHGEDFSSTYKISSGADEYETSKEKKFEAFLDPFLSIEATLTKSTGKLHIMDYKFILAGFYTKR